MDPSPPKKFTDFSSVTDPRDLPEEMSKHNFSTLLKSTLLVGLCDDRLFKFEIFIEIKRNTSVTFCMEFTCKMLRIIGLEYLMTSLSRKLHTKKYKKYNQSYKV